MTMENTPVLLTLIGSDMDGDALSFAMVTEPVQGTVKGLPPAVTYMPNANFSGTDHFTFHASDGTETSQPATVTITVTAARLSSGDFESGDFTAWSTVGDTRIETAAFGSGPVEGRFQAFLSTAGPVEAQDEPVGNAVPVSDLERFLGCDPGSLDSLATDTVIEGSAIRRTFTARAGDIVSFEWNFLTNEYTNLHEFPPSPVFNDFAFVTITAEAFLEAVSLADTFWSVALSATTFFGETGFTTFSFTIPVTGTYTLSIGVVDVGDREVTSGLLIDNVSLTPASP
jgi:hypothetical protein